MTRNEIIRREPRRGSGCEDRHGNEIYEGDCLKLHIPSGEFVHPVEFEDGVFRAFYPFNELFCCGEFNCGRHDLADAVWCEIVETPQNQ